MKKWIFKFRRNPKIPWSQCHFSSSDTLSSGLVGNAFSNRSGLPSPSDFCPHRVRAYSLVCFGFCCYYPSDSAKFPVVIFPFAHAAILLVTPWYFSSVFCLAKFPFGHVAILLVTSWYFQTYFRLVPVPEAVWTRRKPARRNETLPRNTTISGW